MQKLHRFGLALVLSFMMLAGTAMAQQTANVGQLVSGLITVNVGAIQVDIKTGDITVEDLVDVENVLNDNEIRILNNVLSNNRVVIRNVRILNNLLRDANILNNSQVVVGILSNGDIVFQQL